MLSNISFVPKLIVASSKSTACRSQSCRKTASYLFGWSMRATLMLSSWWRCGDTGVCPFSLSLSLSLSLSHSYYYNSRMVDDITWVKATVNRRLAKGHGFYLQHAKETCLIGLKVYYSLYCCWTSRIKNKKGEDPPNLQGNRLPDVIFSERRGQSQKPEEIYSHIETLVPNGISFI